MGFVTKDVILSLVQDITIPLIVIFLNRLKIKSASKILAFKDNGLDFTKFIGYIFTWILALIFIYFFVQYAFIKLIGATGNVKK